MPTLPPPPPPSQQQAAEAQAARYAAENAILPLFAATETGGGSGENETSTLESIKIAAVLTALSVAIIFISFRHPRDRARSLLSDKPDHEQISEDVLPEAERVFQSLSESELTDEQKATVWATWAYSKIAERLADDINGGKIDHEFADRGFKVKKVWISRSDQRVRPLHARLHGKTVPASSDFWRWPHTGQRLRWPGDREAPMDATIGCRCVCLLSFANQADVSTTIKKIVEHTR